MAVLKMSLGDTSVIVNSLASVIKINFHEAMIWNKTRKINSYKWVLILQKNSKIDTGLENLFPDLQRSFNISSLIAEITHRFTASKILLLNQ